MARARQGILVGRFALMFLFLYVAFDAASFQTLSRLLPGLAAGPGGGWWQVAADVGLVSVVLAAIAFGLHLMTKKLGRRGVIIELAMVGLVSFFLFAPVIPSPTNAEPGTSCVNDACWQQADYHSASYQFSCIGGSLSLASDVVHSWYLPYAECLATLL
ncbi:MAG: hypothetical protein KGI38_02230 [Thaumarchaeota archaeon]|nr:hypothetical protein [Nitrososphaerota archaeon]